MNSFKRNIKNLLALIPKSYRQHPAYRKQLKLIYKAQSWSESQIKDYQNEQLIKIVTLAYKTPGYKSLYDAAGVDVNDFRGIEDLPKLPIVDKHILRKNINSFSFKKFGHHLNTTGGTSGEPFAFYLSRAIFAKEAAFVQSDWFKRSWALNDTSLLLRGAFVGTKDKLWAFDTYSKNLSFSSSHLTEEHLPELKKAYEKYNPSIIQAYPSALTLFCDLTKDKNNFLSDIKLIIFASENLYDWQIKKFKQSFPHSDLFCFYGHAENCSYASWIPGSTTYEFNPIYGYTELLNTNNEPVSNQQEGEIISTGFFNTATPFVRYRTSDRAIKAASNIKGLFNSSLKASQILGRSQEVIVTTNGRYISMTSMSIHSGHFQEIKEFQFHQKKAGHLTMNYVPYKNISEEKVKAIEESFSEKYGDDLKVKLSLVSEIPRTVSGKMRYLIQDLDIKYHDN